MKPMFAKLLLLLAVTGLIVWGTRHYEARYKETGDEIVVMQYKVLDKGVWSMDSAAKTQALSQDESYAKLQIVQAQHKDADRKRRIGFWLSLLLGAVSVLYALYAGYMFVRVVLIKNEGYKTIIAAIEKSSGFPRGGKGGGEKE